MGGQNREGTLRIFCIILRIHSHNNLLRTVRLTPPLSVFKGGKVKPLKASKKDKKDLDEDDKAYLEKKRAGW